MNRYSIITEKNPREIVLLKGYKCAYGKCAFCNYILDNTDDEKEMEKVNFEVLKNIKGNFGVLEVINSGSVFELSKATLKKIKNICDDKNIKVIYFEAYFGYLKRLDEIREYFKNQEIRFIIGIETFNNYYRTKVLKKNFMLNDTVLKQLKEQYQTALLMICTHGQTKKQILSDIEQAKKHFKEVVISIFIDNGTEIKRDEKLVKWFLKDIFPVLNKEKNIEILVDNKDFGVYVQ